MIDIETLTEAQFCELPLVVEGESKEVRYAGGMRCVGGGKTFPGSYCTANCQNDTDCPSRYTCRQLGSAGRVCAKREFCDQCTHDGQCGTDSRCIQQGGRKVCARRCSPGSTICPTYAKCQAMAGGNYCVHRAGSCVGSGGLCSPCNETGNCKSGACFTCSFSDEEGHGAPEHAHRRQDAAGAGEVERGHRVAAEEPHRRPPALTYFLSSLF